MEIYKTTLICHDIRALGKSYYITTNQIIIRPYQ